MTTKRAAWWGGLALAFVVGVAQAAQVTIEWDANPPAEGVQGYTIYQGTAPRTYGAQKLDVTTGTKGTVTVPDTGKTYLAVTAWRMVGATRLESGYSNEVVHDPATYAVPAAPANARATQITITRPDGTVVQVTVP